MNDAAKQAVLGHLVCGLYALTVKRGAGGDEHGVAVTWVSQASSDPAMVVVALDSTSSTIELIRDTRHFAISVLHDGQRDLAEKLGGGGRGSQTLKGIKTKPAPISGAPLLTDALGWLECRVVATLPSGSHTLVLGEVVEAGLGAGA